MSFRILFRVIAYSLLCCLLACHSWKLRDDQGQTIAKYTADIEANPNDHNAYYRRARLYMQHYDKVPYDGGVKQCMKDAEKAVELAGPENERFEYFAQRGYCRAATVWDRFEKHIYTKNHHAIPTGTYAEITSAAIEDFTKALALAKNNSNRGLMLELRAILMHRQKKHELVAADLLAMWKFYDGRKHDHTLVYDHRSESIREIHHVKDLVELEMHTAEALVAEAKVQQSPKLADYEELLITTRKQLAEYDKAVSDAYANESKQQEAARYYQAQQQKQRAEQQERQRQDACIKSTGKSCPVEYTCEECRGTGHVMSYEIGQSRECYTETSLGGLRKTTCTAAKEGGHRSGICPVCKGRGVVYKPQ